MCTSLAPGLFTERTPLSRLLVTEDQGSCNEKFDAYWVELVRNSRTSFIRITSEKVRRKSLVFLHQHQKPFIDFDTKLFSLKTSVLDHVFYIYREEERGS